MRSFISRRNRASLAALAVATVGSSAALAGSYTTPGALVPDNLPAGLTINFNVTDTDPVSTIDLSMLWPSVTGGTAGGHTWVGDLRAVLTAPGGASAVIFSRTGRAASATTGFGDSSDLTGNYRYIDTGGDFVAAAALAGAAPVANGDYRASIGGILTAEPSPLLNTVFAGVNPLGNWTLFITDGAAGDTGTLTSATLNITTVPEPTMLGALSLAGIGLLARRRR